MIDPITDFLTRICNASMVKHETLEVPASKIKHDVTGILKRKGSIHDVEYIENDKQSVVRVFLKYGKNEEYAVTSLKRISEPGSHAYVKADEISKVLSGLGIAIISASEGVITNKEARMRNIGGEVIAYVW